MRGPALAVVCVAALSSTAAAEAAAEGQALRDFARLLAVKSNQEKDVPCKDGESSELFSVRSY